jgi:hypothetical protein
MADPTDPKLRNYIANSLPKEKDKPSGVIAIADVESKLSSEDSVGSGEQNTGSEKKKEKEEVASLSELFRFADAYDWFLITCGTIASVVVGFAQV